MIPVPCGSLSSYRFEREFASRGIPVLMEDCLTKAAHCPAAQSGDVMERFFLKKSYSTPSTNIILFFQTEPRTGFSKEEMVQLFGNEFGVEWEVVNPKG